MYVDNNDDGCLKGVLVVLAIMVSIFLCGQWYKLETRNAITVEKAQERFEEMYPESDVVIIRHSNLSYISGDINLGRFELRVDGEFKSAECSSSWTSEMVCWISE